MEPWESDLRYAVDVSVDDPSSLTPIKQLAWWWQNCMHYHYEGRYHNIVPIQACRRRKYGACGDAAASLLAAAQRQGIRARMCVEEPAAFPDYRHVRVTLVESGLMLDPYASFRPRIVDERGQSVPLPVTCEREIDV